jgi:hypothetical protein
MTQTPPGKKPNLPNNPPTTKQSPNSGTITLSSAKQSWSAGACSRLGLARSLLRVQRSCCVQRSYRGLRRNKRQQAAALADAILLGSTPTFFHRRDAAFSSARRRRLWSRLMSEARDSAQLFRARRVSRRTSPARICAPCVSAASRELSIRRQNLNLYQILCSRRGFQTACSR